MRHLLEEEGLTDEIELDSAGTGAWHIGKPPDARATEAAGTRGITLEGQGRQVSRDDFDDADLILAMDRENLMDVMAIAPDEQAREKVRLLREFDPDAAATGNLDVPDPYYGGADGFENVLDLVERACRGLLEHVRANPSRR